MTPTRSGLADLEDFFRDDLRTHHGVQEVRDLVAERDEDAGELYLDLWHAEFDFAREIVSLRHDVEDRASVHRIRDFMAALEEYATDS